MAKYVIIVKRSGKMFGEYFCNIRKSLYQQSYFTSETKRNAMKFENREAAMAMYRRIEDWATVANDKLAIIEL